MAGEDRRARINYVADMSERPLFHAQDHARDNLRYDPQVMAIHDARSQAEAPTLDREGLCLAQHRSAVSSFHDREAVQRTYLPETAELIQQITGAAKVYVVPGGGLVRYAERSPLFGTGMNTQPARFPHIDFTRLTAPGLVQAPLFGVEAIELQSGQRLVGYNLWRVLTPPPQDVPLAVCDARSVAPQDLLIADGVYDEAADPAEWPTSEAYLVRHNPAHRWLWYPDMSPDEVLVFRAYDSDPVERPCVPHSAFDNDGCPPGARGRESIEARAFAVFDS